MKKLKEFLIKNNKKFIIAASIVIIIIALVNIYFVVEVNVISNDECLWVEKKASKEGIEIIFDLIKYEGAAWNAGIRDGDQLLKINDVPITNTHMAMRVLNKVEEGDYAIYTIKSDDRIFTTNVYVKKLFFFGLLASALLGFFWILIGFVVLMAKPEGTIQKLFYGIGAAAVLASTNVILESGYHTNNWILLATSYLWSVSACYLPFLLVYFFWTFPKPFKFINIKWINTSIFLIPGILSIAAFSIVLLVFYFNQLQFHVLLAIIIVLQILTSIAQITAYISLIINYRRLETKEEKKPIKIILGAFTLAIAALLYTGFIAPAITDTVFNSPDFYAPIILVTIFPLAFAYAIFKYQLLDVSVVAKNTIIYGAATLAIAAIYFLVIYITGQWLSQIIVGAEYQGIIAGVFFIIFALVFQSTKNKFQDFLTARFYPEQFAYQKVLIRFSNEVSSMVGLENILDSMKETFVQALRINHFGILVRERNGNYILVRNVGVSNVIKLEDGSNLKEFIKKKVELSKHPIIEQDDFTEVFPEQSKQLIEDNIFTIIPMIIKSKVVGLLLFGLKRSGSQFAGKDLELLYAAANQSAVAIENARLYETEAEKLKIERDLNLARKIQQGLLPKCIPDMQGLDICGEMIPAMQVGGDYFDLIPVSETKLFVVVGDVSGKGLSASLYMTKLQTMIQLACTIGKAPKEILVEINKRFYESVERNSFVTMTLALFDTERGKITFCRAGHMPLLIADNGSVNTYRTQGLGVGLEKGLIFEKTLIEEEIDFKPGQIYAFFSDGITEAMNEKPDLFGEEKLGEILKNKSNNRSSEIMDEIWNELNIFRGKAEQNDDMTMVLVKIKDTSRS